MITETLLSQEGVSANSEQLAQIQKLFPNCFDASGRFLLEKFQSEIAEQADISREFYEMNWLGKSYAKLLRNLPPETLLCEDKAHNAKPENKNSQNLLIQGDNLDVLKHLKNAYTGKVKMIYIDPPYNTGSDGFVYQDDRKFTPEQLSELAHISLDEAERILKFTAKGSNSHSAWLTFMYPRLYIARDLLKEDGVIFISIDDNEVAQLKLLCDEVFGEGNFVAEMPWKGRGGGADDKNLLQNHEYILMYAKNKNNFATGRKIKTGEKFPKFDVEKERNYKIQLARKWGSTSRREDRPNLFYPVKMYDGTEIYPFLPDGSDGRWRWKKARFEQALEDKDIEFNQRDDGYWEAYEKIYEPKDGDFRMKLYAAWLQSELIEELDDLLDEEDCRNTAFGTKQVKILFDGIKVFDYPKPTNLIKILSKIGAVSQSDIILDFFGGSGTTAHAVMQLNAEDNGNRQFILVQLPEKTDEKSEAFKAGYKTIFDITKARIEKAAAKIQSENPNVSGDLGFKIYQTTDHFRRHTDEEFSPKLMTLPYVENLTDKQMDTLLTTWALNDGALLTDPICEVKLGNYTAHLCDKLLYLMQTGFTSADLLAFIQKLDNDTDFNPNRVIVFGENMPSHLQQELNQAIETYRNKKNISLSLIIRN